MAVGAHHDDIAKAGKDTGGILNGLMPTQMNHARPQVLGMTAQLRHSSLERDSRARGYLLKDHSERLSLHQGRIITVLDRLLNCDGKLDDILSNIFQYDWKTAVFMLKRFCWNGQR